LFGCLMGVNVYSLTQRNLKPSKHHYETFFYQVS
jgi:hypothetical protein